MRPKSSRFPRRAPFILAVLFWWIFWWHRFSKGNLSQNWAIEEALFSRTYWMCSDLTHQRGCWNKKLGKQAQILNLSKKSDPLPFCSGVLNWLLLKFVRAFLIFVFNFLDFHAPAELLYEWLSFCKSGVGATENRKGPRFLKKVIKPTDEGLGGLEVLRRVSNFKGTQFSLPANTEISRETN